MASKTFFGAVEIYRFCKDLSKVPAEMRNVSSNTPHAYAEYIEKNWANELPGFPGLTGSEICQHSADRINHSFSLGFTAKDVLEMIRSGYVSSETLLAKKFFNYGTSPDGSSINEYSYDKDQNWRVIVGERFGYKFALVKIEGSEPCYNNLCCLLSKTEPVPLKPTTMTTRTDTVYVVLCPEQDEPVAMIELPDSGFDQFMGSFKTAKPAVESCNIGCPRYYGSDRSYYERRGNRMWNLSLGFWANNTHFVNQQTGQDIIPVGNDGYGSGTNDNSGYGSGTSSGNDGYGSGTWSGFNGQ